MATTNSELVILVFNAEHRAIGNAEVSIALPDGQLGVEYDASMRAWRCSVPQGTRVPLHVVAPMYEPQEKSILVDRPNVTVRFCLGRPGDAYTYMDGMKYPYKPQPGRIVVLGRIDTPERKEEVLVAIHGEEGRPGMPALVHGSNREIGADFKAHPESKQRAQFKKSSMLVVDKVLPPTAKAHGRIRRDNSLRAVRSLPYVSAAGPVFMDSVKRPMIFTHRLIVVFYDITPDHERELLFALAGIVAARPIIGQFGAFIAEVGLDIGEEINDVLELFASSPFIASVSPDLAVLPDYRAIQPNDFLWPAEWDRIYIKCPEAWQLLNDEVNTSRKFGDPNVSIAIIDSGIRSVNGVPENLDFQGHVSNKHETKLTEQINPLKQKITVASAAGFNVNDMIQISRGEEGSRKIHSIAASPLGGGAQDFEIDSFSDVYEAGTPVFLPTGGGSTELVADAEPKYSTLKVLNVGTIQPGDSISIEPEGNAQREHLVVKAVNSPVITTTPVRNAHLINAPVERGRKVFALQDFDGYGYAYQGIVVDPGHVGPENDQPPIDPVTGLELVHGINCAGIAAANAENTDSTGTKVVGIAGVSPNARLVGIIPKTFINDYQGAFIWAGGLGGYTTSPLSPDFTAQADVPELRPGADIISCSLGIYSTGAAGTLATDLAVLKRLTRRGRGGRGTLVFVAAGNEPQPMFDMDYAALAGAMAVGGTYLAVDPASGYLHEGRVWYTSWSNFSASPDAWVEFSAPTGSDRFHEYYPPRHRGILTATRVGMGNFAGYSNAMATMQPPAVNRRVETRLEAGTGPGARFIRVVSTAHIVNNDWIRIGQVGDNTIDWVQVTNVVDAEWLQINPAPANFHCRWNPDPAPASPATSVSVAPPGAAPIKTIILAEPYGATPFQIGCFISVVTPAGTEWVNVTAVADVGGLTQIDVYPLLTAKPVAGAAVDFSPNGNVKSPRTVIAAHEIEVDTMVGFTAPGWVTIGPPGATKTQAAHLHAIIPPNPPAQPNPKFRISGLLDTYDPAVAPVRIYQGPNDYNNRFNGTSAATPLVAGVAALVLAAKPTLTWIEVRQFLRDTADRIDIKASFDAEIAGAADMFDGRWVNRLGEPLLRSTGVYSKLSGNDSVAAGGVAAGAEFVPVTSVTRYRTGQIIAIGATPTMDIVTITWVDTVNRHLYVYPHLTFGHAGGVTVILPGGATPIPPFVGVTAAAAVGATNVIKHGTAPRATDIVILNAILLTSGQTIKITNPTVPGGPPPASYTGTFHRTKDLAKLEYMSIDPPLTVAIMANATVEIGEIPYELRHFNGDTDIDTVGGRSVRAGERVIRVDSTNIFTVDCVAAFESFGHLQRERHRVESINPTARTITLATPLAFDHANGSTIYTGRADVTGGVAMNGTTIPVDDAHQFAEGQAVQIGAGATHILTTVRSVPSTTSITIYPPLPRAITPGEDVRGGRVAYRSGFYGSGRINAEAAVKAAIDYTHELRDLMIRSYEGDLGTTAIVRTTTALSSPDIWIRNIDPAIDGLNALPAGYQRDKNGLTADGESASHNSKAPHQQPNRATNRYIYARIANRGNALDGLEATARIYVYRSRSNAPFTIRQLWDDSVTGALISTNSAGSFLIGEKSLFNAPTDANIRALNGDSIGGIKYGRHFIVKGEWPAAQIPAPGPLPTDRLRTHILVEITPYDGLLAGDTVGANNNVATREISFAELRIKKNATDLLPKSIDMKRGATTPTNIPFRIELEDAIGYFQTRRVEIEVTQRKRDGTVVTFKLRYDGATWSLTDPAQAWFTFAVRPKDLVTNADIVDANSDQVGIYFTGAIDIASDVESVELKALLYSHADANQVSALLAEKTHRIRSRIKKFTYDGLSIPSTPGTDICAFTEFQKLVAQTADQAFGPKSARRFRLTSSFTIAAGGGTPADDANVYAASSGILMVQRVTDSSGADGDYADDIVNVIIKPMYQSEVDFTPVKYYVYRGVKLTDFLRGKEPANDVLVKANAGGSSEFIQMLDEHQQARRAAYDAVYPTNTPNRRPPLDIPSTDIGWDRAKDDDELLDQLFMSWSNENSEKAIQLPIVTQGMWIGSFAHGSTVGFEIVLEGGTFEPTLGWARMRAYEIDLDVDDLDEDEEPERREDILCFVDPAAFYGLHFDAGLYIRTGTNDSEFKRADDLYTTVISKFETRNTVYIDVRNEHGNSLNYYKNYAVEGAGIRTGSNPDNPAEALYKTSEWPLVIYRRTAGDESDPDAELDTMYVSLPRLDNQKGVLYVESGTSVSLPEGTRFAADALLHTAGEPWTNPVGFDAIQVTQGASDVLVASILKLHYGRGVDTAKVWPPNSPVPKFESYTDNLFGPIDIKKTWVKNTGTKITWENAHDLRYVDGTNANPAQSFGAMVERGVAFEENSVLFFTGVVDFQKVGAAAGGALPVGLGVDGGASPQESLLDASILFRGFTVETVAIQDTPPGASQPVAISVLRLTPRDANSVPQAVMLLGITTEQYEDLLDAAGDLSDKHARNLVLKKDAPASPATDFTHGTQIYHRYRVEARGLDEDDLISLDVEPGDPIYVYSVDGLCFTGASFDMSAIVPDTYVGDAEENRAVSDRDVDDLIKLDTQIEQRIEQFKTAIQGVDPKSPTAKDQLQTIINNQAPLLLDRARAFAFATPEGADRPLYWARLRMAVALKSLEFSRKNPAARDELATLFDRKSRGLEDIDYTGQAGTKILLVGFDPFDLDTDITEANPAGIVALALDGQPLAGTNTGRAGYVQSVILPIRYRDFDAGMVDAFFEKYLYTTPVGLIVTMNQNGAKWYFDIERFSARFRTDAAADNEDKKGVKPVGTGADWGEFYETNLPIVKAMAGIARTGPPTQFVYYDQSYESIEANGTTHSLPHPSTSQAHNLDANVAGTTATGIVGDSARGSAGNFLSNEVFYRASRLRLHRPGGGAASSVIVGHISIPAPSWTRGYTNMTMQNVLTQTRGIIERALDGVL